MGITNYLLTALVNSGGKMFNVSKIEGSLQQLDGKVLQKLKKYEFGEPLGPREQRSYRYPFSPPCPILPHPTPPYSTLPHPTPPPYPTTLPHHATPPPYPTPS